MKLESHSDQKTPPFQIEPAPFSALVFPVLLWLLRLVTK